MDDDKLERLGDDARRLGLYMPPSSWAWQMEVRNRVKELINVVGRDIRPHPKNPRRHPDAQVNALRAVLTELGIAGVLIAYYAGDGVLTLIDGECRQSNFLETVWPCVVLNVNDAEAELLLATYDPLSAQATMDADALEELLGGIKNVGPDVQALLDEVARQSGIVLDDTPPAVPFQEFNESCANEVKYIECPNCHHKWPR